jgi:hypothetical protein
MLKLDYRLRKPLSEQLRDDLLVCFRWIWCVITASNPPDFLLSDA